MSVVLQNPVPRTRRRHKKEPVEEIQLEESPVRNKHSDEQILENLRQSIEKVDNSNTMQNNLYNPEVPDKMERRQRRRQKKSTTEGHNNPTYDDDEAVAEEHMKKAEAPQQQQQRNLPENVSEDQPQKRRRKKKPKSSEMETVNEDLSTSGPVTGQSDTVDTQNKEGKKQKGRRRRQKEREESVENENMAGPQHEENELQNDPLTLADSGTVLNVIIHRTDRLKTDLNVLNPLVKVSIVDITTGQFVVKQNRDRRVTSCNEETDKIANVLPIMTQSYEFKFHKGTIPSWEEPIVFNENANYLTKNPNIVIFFELLDLNSAHSISKHYNIQQQSSGFRNIAWAFLRPMAANGTLNVDRKVRLQLYECGPIRSAGDHNSIVFNWWQMGHRQAYPSTLYVTLACIRLKPQDPAEVTSRSMYPHHTEGVQHGSLGQASSLTFNKSLATSKLHQWNRLPGQMCHLPNRQLMTLSAGLKGTNVISFSPDGSWLACGSMNTNDDFPVLLYNISDGLQYPSLTFVGHNRIIHCISWCTKSELLASASADGTCRLWKMKNKQSDVPKKESSKVKENEMKDTDRLPSTSENAEQVITEKVDRKVLSHPCFVYTVKFHPRTNNVLVTAGYDKVIRIWDVSGNKKEMIQQLDIHKGFINCIAFSADGHLMFSADSQGHIHTFHSPVSELNPSEPIKEKWSHKELIAELDLQGIIINCLCLSPTGKRLYVHGRDGNIRLIDLKIKGMVLKFHGIVNVEKNLRSSLSPCGSFLFSGSEDCSEGPQVFVWNAQTGDHVAIFKSLNLPGPVCSIDYHPKCHLMAFAAMGGEASVLIYVYDQNEAKLDIGYGSGNSGPPSPRLAGRPIVNPDKLTSLEESSFRTGYLAGEESRYNSFQKTFEQRNTDRLSRILNALNSVTEADRSLRRANRSMDRDVFSSRHVSNDGYQSGPEDKGRIMRTTNRSTTLEAIPMSLNATSSSKANFTFKPPPSGRQQNKNQTRTCLGEVVALYDYQAQRFDELSFARGEVIKVLFRDGKNWLLGETNDGSQGYVPTNYIAGEDTLQEVSVDQDQDQTDGVDNADPNRQRSPKTRFSEVDEIIDNGDNNRSLNTNTAPSKRSRQRRRQQTEFGGT